MRFADASRFTLVTLVAAAALAATPQAHAAPAKPSVEPTPAKEAAKVALDVQRVKLDNGLRVVLSVDRTSPTVAVDIVYDVGSRNEERGRSGFAHLFEHMMFQGSKNVERGEHFKLVSGHGGSLNGTTSSDRTNYFEMMPRSELALALWLEADRMKALDVSQSNFENQRAVVKEEYRMRVENAAYVPAEIELERLIFEGYWPYEHATIGSMADLDSAKLEWVQAFHGAYYAPNNAVLSIAGDFDSAEALALVKRYFGDAKPNPAIPKYTPPSMPEQKTPRTATVVDPHAKLSAVLLGFATPPSREPDHYALELAAALLGDGESARLHRVLVREKAIAVDADAGMNRHRGPDAFEFSVRVAQNSTVEKVEAALWREINALAKTAPTAAEMKKLQNRLRSQFVFGLQTNFARAQRLAEFELYWGDANLLSGELEKYLAVSAEDIRRVTAKYLTTERSSRVEVKPVDSSPPAKPTKTSKN